MLTLDYLRKTPTLEERTNVEHHWSILFTAALCMATLSDVLVANVAGICGVTTDVADGIPVVIDSAGVSDIWAYREE